MNSFKIKAKLHFSCWLFLDGACQISRFDLSVILLPNFRVKSIVVVGIQILVSQYPLSEILIAQSNVKIMFTFRFFSWFRIIWTVFWQTFLLNAEYSKFSLQYFCRQHWYSEKFCPAKPVFSWVLLRFL